MLVGLSDVYVAADDHTSGSILPARRSLKTYHVRRYVCHEDVHERRARSEDKRYVSSIELR